MRRSPSAARRLAAAALAVVGVSAAVLATWTLLARRDHGRTTAGALTRAVTVPSTRAQPTTTTTSTTSTTTTTAPVAAPPPAFATGNPQLDALLPTLPPVLFEGGAQVRFGYNPRDCCHSGGYDHELNVVWVSERAAASDARLTYVAVHELAHSVHLKSDRGPALTAAVGGAPVVRAGPMDDSEKVADCVSWALYPGETAAAGIAYWSCPDPWRVQVLAALG